jgi:7-cyano-7-deazaguanine synthase
MPKRVLVLHSGGMDSTTCLYKAKAEGAEVLSLGIDYRQQLAVEMVFAKRQCEALQIPRDIVSVSWTKPQRPIQIDRDVSEMSKSISPAYLPGRNVIFLSLACAHAAGVAADEVQIGLNSVDFSGYPDCTVDFFDAYRSMVRIAFPDGPQISAPFLTFSKPEIARLAKDLSIGKHDTWSCYNPQVTLGGLAPCHQCDACRLHDYAWRSIE